MRCGRNGAAAIWANGLVIVIASMLSLYFVVHLLLGTLTRRMPQFSLLAMPAFINCSACYFFSPRCCAFAARWRHALAPRPGAVNRRVLLGLRRIGRDGGQF
jgi:hypothetical protein